MARREFTPLDLLFQLESDMRRHSETSMRAVLFQPRLDMFETDGALVVKMELAGVKPERIQITLSSDDRALTIAGDRIEPNEAHRDRLRCYHLEIYYGTFEREIALPANIHLDRDRITATYKDGFLTISLPKRSSASPEKRTIEITNA